MHKNDPGAPRSVILSPNAPKPSHAPVIASPRVGPILNSIPRTAIPVPSFRNTGEVKKISASITRSPTRNHAPVLSNGIKAVRVVSGAVTSAVQGAVREATHIVSPVVHAILPSKPHSDKESELYGGKRRRDDSEDEEEEEDDEDDDEEDDDSEDDSIVVSDSEIVEEGGDLPDDDSNLKAAAEILQEEAKRIIGDKPLESKEKNGRTLRARPKPNLEAAERARIVMEAHQADEISEMYKLMSKWKTQHPTLSFPEKKHLSYDQVKKVYKEVKAKLNLYPSSDEEEDSEDEAEDDDESASELSDSEGDDSEDSSEESSEEE